MVDAQRNQRIIENLALVHAIANRFRNRGAEYEDLFQAGCVGLIKAVDNFDESRGFKFSTYAVPVIMGEIKRLFRDDGAVKISRSLKEKAFYIRNKRDEYICKYASEPTLKELAEYTGTDVEQLTELLALSNPVSSLSVLSDEGIEELDVSTDNTDALFDRLTVVHLFSLLESKEKKLIYLRYFEGKTQSETAKQLGISQVQVSRKEKAILEKLKRIMQ